MASLFAQQLKRLGACSKAIEWVENKEFGEAWASCEDSYWLFWLAEKLGVNLKLFIQIACRCTRLVLHLVPKGEERPREAIEAAEGWLEGKVSVEEVQVVNDAAWAAIQAVKVDAWAARAAAWATEVATMAGTSTTWATTWAVWDACVAYASKAARVTNNSQILNIIRDVMTEPVREKLTALEV